MHVIYRIHYRIPFAPCQQSPRNISLQSGGVYGTILRMEYLVTSFHVVAPLLILMAVGLLLRVTKIASKDVFSVMNRIVYYAGLPCMMFHNIIRRDSEASVDWAVVALSVGSVLVLFALFWLILPRFVKDPRRRGAITQACVRSNDSIFSLTVAASMLGEGNFALTVTTAALVAVENNLLSIITLRQGIIELCLVAIDRCFLVCRCLFENTYCFRLFNSRHYRNPCLDDARLLAGDLIDRLA